MRRFQHFLSLALSILVASPFLAGCYRLSGRPAVVVDPDKRAPFTLDASKPFVIELGRGNGLYGLNTVKISESGVVDLYRAIGGPNFENASLQLPPARVKELVDIVNGRHLTKMGRVYHTDPETADGSQWVLWIEQGSAQKGIYFNNAFPDEITGFADQLDALLQKSGLQSATWAAAPAQQSTSEQNALWDHIK